MFDSGISSIDTLLQSQQMHDGWKRLMKVIIHLVMSIKDLKIIAELVVYLLGKQSFKISKDMDEDVGQDGYHSTFRSDTIK